MRPLIASTFICLAVMPGSLGFDQRAFSSRLDDVFAVAAVPAGNATSVRNKTQREEKTADRLAPPADTFSSVRLADAAPALISVSNDAPIDIPPEAGTAQLLVPRDLPAPPPAPPPKPVVHRSPREVCDTLAAAAQRNDLPVPFFIRLLFQESRFKPGAVSRTGA
jgi:hypothetical protein